MCVRICVSVRSALVHVSEIVCVPRSVCALCVRSCMSACLCCVHLCKVVFVSLCMHVACVRTFAYFSSQFGFDLKWSGKSKALIILSTSTIKKWHQLPRIFLVLSEDLKRAMIFQSRAGPTEGPVCGGPIFSNVVYHPFQSSFSLSSLCPGSLPRKLSEFAQSGFLKRNRNP